MAPGHALKMACAALRKPNERFSYSWKGGDEANVGYGSRLDTVVTFTLDEVDGGTRLRVVHSGFVLPRNETAYRNMSGGWSQVVGRIAAVTEEEASAQAGSPRLS